MRVYHCSTVKIDKFEIPYNGLHFGSYHSGLQAVERKITDEEVFWVHEVELDLSNVEDVFDCGESWAETLEGDTSKVFSYTNKYEPSTKKSYVIFDTKFIKCIRNVKAISVNEVVMFESH